MQVNRRAGAPAGIEGLLEMVFGQEVFDVAVLLDRPVRRRRVMLWAIGQDGQPLGVVKLSREAFDQPSLEREYEALCSSSPAVPGLRRPSALAYVRWRGHDVLAVEALTPAARATAVEVPMEQMQAVAGFPERSPEPLAQTSFATHLAAQVSALDPDIGGRWASEAFEDLLARYGTVLVTPGPCHGDWTWWNMAWDGDVVMLWDWEHFSEHAIQGFDHLHFLSRAQHHASTGAASEDLWVAQAQAALARAWEVTGELEQEAVIAAYLLDMNVRHFADRQYLGPGVEPSRDWGPALLERLTLNAAQPRIPPGA